MAMAAALSDAEHACASSSLSARGQAGAAYVFALELRKHSPEFGGHRGGVLCNRRVVRVVVVKCLEMDGRRGWLDGGGCDVEVSGDDGWRRSSRFGASYARVPSLARAHQKFSSIVPQRRLSFAFPQHRAQPHTSHRRAKQ